MKTFLIGSGVALLCAVALAYALLRILERAVAWFDEEREP